MELIDERLRSYQLDGVNFLLSTSHALLADEMGLGKTVQVASALRRLRSAGVLTRALIVAPSSLLSNWEAELRLWGPDVASRSTGGLDAEDRKATYELPVPIILTSYELVRQDFLVDPIRVVFDVVIFDEAQRVKDPESDTSVAARRISATRRWALSATPLENSLKDTFGLLQLLGIGPQGDSPVASNLIESLQGHFLRRLKRAVLPELPKVIEQELILSLSSEQRDEYDRVAQSITSSSSYSQLLAKISELKQICNRGSRGHSVKLEALEVILDDPDAGSCKYIIISQYVKTLEWLEEHVSVDFARYLYTGRGSPELRDQALNKFRTCRAPAVLLLSLKAGGVGLNIPEATHVILFDRWWNPAVEAQALHRAHRFGRTIPLLLYKMTCQDTVEERIQEILASKQRLADDLLEDGRLERGVDTLLSQEELIRILSTNKRSD